MQAVLRLTPPASISSPLLISVAQSRAGNTDKSVLSPTHPIPAILISQSFKSKYSTSAIMSNVSEPEFEQAYKGVLEKKGRSQGSGNADF